MAETNQDSARPALVSAMAAMDAFQQRLMAQHATEFTTLDVTMPQAKLLYVVATAGELSMSEIAARLGVTVSTSSGAVERLVELGLVARSDDPNNRRQVRVSITEMGATTLGQLRELSGRHLLAMLEGCSDEDLDVVERAIRIMASALSQATPPTNDTQVQPAGSPASNPVESRGS